MSRSGTPLAPFRCYALGMDHEATMQLLYAIEVAEAGAVRTVIVRACSVDVAVAEAAAANEAVLSVHLAREIAPGEYQLGAEVPYADAA